MQNRWASAPASGVAPGQRTGTPRLEDQPSQLQAEGARVRAHGLPRRLCSQQLLQSWQLLPLRARNTPRSSSSGPAPRGATWSVLSERAPLVSVRMSICAAHVHHTRMHACTYTCICIYIGVSPRHFIFLSCISYIHVVTYFSPTCLTLTSVVKISHLHPSLKCPPFAAGVLSDPEAPSWGFCCPADPWTQHSQCLCI